MQLSKNLFAKIAIFTLVITIVWMFSGCGNQNKAIEKNLVENGYYIEATDSGVSIKKFYKNNNEMRAFSYNPETNNINYCDEYLLENIRVDLVSGKIANNLTDIPNKFLKKEATMLQKYANKELNNLNLSQDELLKYMNYKMSKDPNSVGNNSNASIEIEKEPNPIINKTKLEYLTLTHLDKYSSNLESELGGIYYYKDIPLLSKDCDILDTYGVVDQGAIYRKIATLLEGFNTGFNSGSQYSQYVIGDTISEKADFEPYYNKLSKFITTENSLENVMNKFKSLKSIEGDFNNNTKSYNFKINNLSNCAKEMNISEEMLGAILAMIDEYAPTIEFDGDSYSCKLKIK